MADPFSMQRLIGSIAGDLVAALLILRLMFPRTAIVKKETMMVGCTG
jgi:hypothetical protein